MCRGRFQGAVAPRCCACAAIGATAWSLEEKAQFAARRDVEMLRLLIAAIAGCSGKIRAPLFGDRNWVMQMLELSELIIARHVVHLFRSRLNSVIIARHVVHLLYM